MPKKEKAKAKGKAGAASEEDSKSTAGDKILTVDQAEEVSNANGWGISEEDKVNNYGGWGALGNEEDHGAPDESWKAEAEHSWDNPPQNLEAWMDAAGEDPPHKGGNVTPISVPDHQGGITHAALMESIAKSPGLLAALHGAGESHTSLQRSLSSVTRNPTNTNQSYMPTRANSITGGHAPTSSFAQPTSHLQQTRYGLSKPGHPLSTIHSTGSYMPEPASAPAASSRQWIPGSGGGYTSTGTNTRPASALPPARTGFYATGPFPTAQAMSMLGGHFNISSEMLETSKVTPGNVGTVSFQESGGEALFRARKALFGAHRPAAQRLYWILPPEHDERVSGLLHWVEAMSHGLASLAIHKFITMGSRGALISNADYRPDQTPEEPAFDWITFEQSRGTLDRIFQEAIATYDPTKTFIVYVFLLSSTGNSAGIWRRKLPIPVELQLAYRQQLIRVSMDLAKKKHVVAVEMLPPGAKTPAPRSSTIKMPVKPSGSMTPGFVATKQPLLTKHFSAPAPTKNVLSKPSSSSGRKEGTDKKKKRSTITRFLFGDKK